MGTICDITMFDPATNSLYAYVPLIINAGAKNFVPAAAPKFYIPNPSTVMYMGCGTNAVTTTLQDNQNGAGLALANCTVSGLVQYAGCNGPNFYGAVKAALAAGTYKAPALALSPVNNRLCYTDFSCAMTDMDPQDNAPSIYLLSKNLVVAQATFANLANPQFTVAQGAMNVTIGSDMVVQNVVYDTALQCADFTIPSAIDGLLLNTMGNTNIFAIANDLNAHENRVCVVPLNDAFVTATGTYTAVDTQPGSMAFTKMNEKRVLTGLDPITSIAIATQSAKIYCARFLAYSSDVIFNAFHLVEFTAAMPVANNMATFMTQRFVASWAGLGCADPNIGIGLAFPFSNFMSNPNSGIVDGVVFTANSATPQNASDAQQVLNSAFFELGTVCAITSNNIIQPNGPTQCSDKGRISIISGIQSKIVGAIKMQSGISVIIDEPTTATTGAVAAVVDIMNDTAATAAAKVTATITVAATFSVVVVTV
ncbi:hypothetical protein HDU84_004495 [Entophlyctis sp. JEL0112]|nr:hypothetical protein HDU84_004495 [Entophlyctis sp. JEL0112]